MTDWLHIRVSPVYTTISCKGNQSSWLADLWEIDKSSAFYLELPLSRCHWSRQTFWMDEAGLEVHDFKGNGKEKMHGANLNLLGQQGKTK